MRWYDRNHDGPHPELELISGRKISERIATAAAVAFVVFACTDKVRRTDMSGWKDAPIQSVTDMFAVQTTNGDTELRMEAPLMNRYENDSASTEDFPAGLALYGYDAEGNLESIIVADEARHVILKDGRRTESWSAFGNVVIHNVLKQETMETDTIYWDRSKKEIYTDCYVKMYPPSGLLQGYGMRTDERARNSILHNPFNGYGVTVRDSTKVIVDSVNFIGPFMKNN